MSFDTRMSMSLLKRPCKNRYPGRSRTRFPSTAGPMPVLAEVTSAIFALCSISEGAVRRRDISLPATHHPHHPPSR